MVSQSVRRVMAPLLCALLMLGRSGHFLPQSSGTLSGRVSDPDGAVVQGVLITLRNRSIGYERTTETNPDGLYDIAGLAAGTYQIEVRATGFRIQVVNDFAIDVGRTGVQDFQLQIGDLAQQLSVTANGPLTPAATLTVGRVLDQEAVRDLPLNGRNFLELNQLEPAVKVQSDTNPGTLANNYSRVTVGGSYFSQTRISVDGSTVNDRFVGGTILNLSQELVQEFQVSTFNFDLASGTPGAAVVNIISRRGENDVHGSGFFYYRDHNLAAYPGLARNSRNASPFFGRRQSGLSISGPIKRDRLFWFGNYERNQQDAVFAVTNNHPAFSKLDVIYPNPLAADLFNMRMDRAGEHSQAFVRYSSDRNRTTAPAATVGMPSNWQSLRNRALQVQAGLTSIASSITVNAIRASYSYLNGQLRPLSETDCRDPVACVGIGQPSILVFDAPQFRIGKQNNSPFPRWERNYQLIDDLTWQRGRHLLRIGGEWEHVYWKASFAFNDPAQITLWGPTNLATPALKPIYDALPASLKDPKAPPPTLSDILQLPLRSFVAGIGNPTLPVPYNFDKASRNDRVRLYFQDTWRIRPDLTLNAGLAYSHESHLFQSDLHRPAYLAALLEGNLRAPQPPGKSFDPALGLAWNPDRNRKTTLRVGAGMFTDQIAFYWSARERAFIAPSGSGRINVDGALTPYNFVSVPTSFRGADLIPLLPAVREEVSSKLGNGSDPSTSAIEVIKQGGDIAAPDSRMTYSAHFTGGVQRQISNNLVFSADYVMRRYVKLGPLQDVFVQDANRFNRPLVTGADATTGEVSFVRNPIIPLCSPAQAAALNPGDYCSTGPINISSSGANDRYQALQLKLEQRFAGGSQVSASYSLSSNTGFVEFTNYNDHRDAYGNLADSNRHSITFSFVWNVRPYDRAPILFRELLKSWTVSGLSQIRSAPPLDTILTGLDLDGDGISRTLLPGTSHNSLGYGLSTARLRALVAAYNADVDARSRQIANTDGTVSVIRPRTPFNQIINPIALPAAFSNPDSFASQDLRLTRKIALAESVTLSVIAEAFNVFNIANLTGYSNVLNQPNYGQPSARVGQVFGSGGPRAFQFAARLTF